MAHRHADEESAPLLDHDGDSQSPPSLHERLKSTLVAPSSLNGLEKALAVLAVLLLLLATTAFGLFAGEAVKYGKHKHEPSAPGSTTTAVVTSTVTASPLPTTTRRPSPPGQDDEVCMTPECVTIASTIITALDTSVDPCEDFYAFSNGGWLKTHPIPEGRGLFGSAQDIDERNKITILDILNSEPDPSLGEDDLNNLEHLKTFYASCLDEDLLDRQGLEPLTPVLKDIITAWRGDLSAKSSFVSQQGAERWDPKTRRTRLTAAFAFLHSRMIPAVFGVYPEGDVGNDPTQNVLYLGQDGLGLPSKDYYLDNETVAVYQEIVRASLKSIYVELGEIDVTDVAALAEEVVSLEKRLAKYTLEAEELDDPHGTYNPQNATELQDLFTVISFPDYFASYSPRPSYPDPVIVASPSYLANASAIVEQTEEDVLEAYFLFRAAQSLGLLLGPKQTIRKEIEWLKNFLGGIKEGVRAPRGDTCYKALLDNYGFLVGRYYVQHAFAGESKEYAEDVIEAVIQAFKARLKELTWLDDKTRAAAEDKASAITRKIGYPTSPNTEDALALERYYSINMPVLKDDFFGNVLRSRLADVRRSWVQVGQPVDKGQWEMIPSEVNAYYSPPANEIAFPAGILQSPYFNKDWPEYLAFGGFGAVAGHELTHAFDKSGRQYNKIGQLEDWWTNSSTTRFNELQQCMLDQYAKYAIIGPDGKPSYIKSQFTNGEDMADGGGIAQSFRAWETRFKSDVQSKSYGNYLLPGLDFTREQLFFIAFAQGWARNIKPAEAVKRIRTDPHSPTNYRVIGTLSNDDNFSEAFKCSKGQPMSNVNKCHVW